MNQANLSEVILKVKARDRAEEIIRNVVKNKKGILDASVRIPIWSISGLSGWILFWQRRNRKDADNHI